MMKLKLNFSDVTNLEKIMDYNIINYQALWMEEVNSSKCLKTKVSGTGSPHILFLMNLTSLVPH